MPIFTKDDQRVYFAHIPKTAGSAIYVLFLRNGWSLSNVQTGLGKKRIGYRLNKEFGLKDIPFEGERHGFEHSLQHAPQDIWVRWGPFTSSFAIVRDPYSKFFSGVRYFWNVKRASEPFEDVARNKIKKLKRQFNKNGTITEPMFKPQFLYVAPDTKVLRFEDSWLPKLCAMYGLENQDLERINEGNAVQSSLSQSDREWVAKTYAKDFETFGYEV
ncbi:MAG: hypothetical protein KUG70_10425 [Rhodobacteraceae bacterium]|nr:hypothetical protein [Paracoccaceae bacterium]